MPTPVPVASSVGPTRFALGAACVLAARGLALGWLWGQPLHVELGAGLPLLLVTLGAALAVTLVAFVRVPQRLAQARPRSAWAGVRGLLYLVAACFVGVLVVSRPGSELLLAFALALAAGVFGAACLARAGRPASRLLSAADLVLALLLGAVLAAEVGLQVAARFTRSPLLTVRPDDAAATVERLRYPPGKLHFGHPVNSWGDYDVEPTELPAGAPLVLSVGDSFSTGMVPLGDHFTSVAEERLDGATIYNMGTWGTGPDEYLELLLGPARELEPRAVVVNLYVGNDITAVRAEQREAPLLDRERWMTWLVARRLLRLAEEDAPLADVDEESPGERAETRADVLRLFPFVEDVTLEHASYSEVGYHRIVREKARAICGPATEAYERCVARVLSLRDACAPAPFGVTLIPDEFQVEDTLWDAVREGVPDVPLDRDQPQRILVERLTAQGIPVLDLLAVLRAVPPLEDGDRHLYHLRDTHFNARGNRVMGEALADFVREELGVR